MNNHNVDRMSLVPEVPETGEWGEALVDLHPVISGLRFFAMRLVRLVVTWVCELSQLVCIAGVVVYGFLSFISLLFVDTSGRGETWTEQYARIYEWSPWRAWSFGHPVITLCLCVVGIVVTLGLILSVGTAYRYCVRVPGSGAVRCGWCSGAISDDFFCSRCHRPRLSRIGTMFVGLLNLLLSVVWAIHDITMFMFVVAYAPHRSGK